MTFSRAPVAVLTVLAIIWPSQAYAYLDPGVGSIILQGLIATAVGAMAFCRIYWERVKSFFKRDKDPKVQATDQKK